MSTLSPQPATRNLLIFLLLLLSTAPTRAETARPELRAFWADGFNEGYKTPQQIDVLLQRLHDAHCNAVFAQMRKGGDAYYASHYEPWATDDGQHFDALACLIERAHRMQPRIAVHAWINTCAVGTGAKHPGTHIAQLHPEWMSVNRRGQADDGEVRKIDPGCPDAADWTFRLYLDVVRHYDVDGIHFDFVRYGSPRFGYNPVSVKRFMRQIPPGYVFAPEPTRNLGRALRQPSSLPSTATRFPGLPTPNDPRWQQWRRDQVTSLVRKVYAHSVQLKPNIVVSAATIAWGNGPHNETEWRQKSAAMKQVFQDWRGWLQEGILDLACPMTYFKGRHGLEYERTWSAWIKSHQYARASAVAVGNWQLLPEQTLAQMRIARAPDAAGRLPYGVMLYSYAGTNVGVQPGRPGLRELELQPDFYALLSHPSSYTPVSPFTADATLPPMPWKEQPKTGILKGFARDPGLLPADGARILLESTRTGRVWKTRADGTGFYAFINLPPDTYNVRAEKIKTSANGTTKPQQARVEAGKVATCPIDVPADISPAGSPTGAQVETLDSIQAVLERAQAMQSVSVPATSAGVATQQPLTGQVRLRNVVVVLGTDTWSGHLYVREASDTTGTLLHVHLRQSPLMPFQPGDVIDIVGVPGRIQDEPGLENAVACLNDVTLDSPPAAFVAATSLNALKNAMPANHGIARFRGVVTQSNADGFTLAPESANEVTTKAQVRVPLAGRKDFGVEAASWSGLRPAVGSIVEVTGLLTTEKARPTESGVVRLLLRSSADITAIAPPAPAQTRRWRTLPAALALLLAALWFGRKRLRRFLLSQQRKPE